MTLTRALALTGLSAAALLAAWPAAAASLSTCDLGAASTEGVAQSADPHALSLDAAHPMALANWNVRWWQRHRVWITLQADNRGDGEARLQPEAVLDLRPNGGASTLLQGLPLVLAPQARATQRLPVYVPDDAKTLGLRVRAREPAPAVTVSLALECSEARFDPGQVDAGVQPLLVEALHTWFDGFVDSLRDAQGTLRTANRLAAGSQDASDIVWTMRGLVQSVGDDRGFALGPGESPPARPPLVTRAPGFAWSEDGVATVRLHAVDSADEAGALAWAGAVHDGVAALAARRPVAWVVDLRDHASERPWAALAALSALLDGPVVGATVSQRERQQWIVERGAARIAGAPAAVDLQAPPERPFQGPVAVLIGPGTRDAGEEVAVAFSGRAHTRFFGEPTAGFPSLGLRVHRLADGSTLGVLETRAADRTGAVHRRALDPDEVAHPGAAGDTPAPALDWLGDEQRRLSGH